MDYSKMQEPYVDQECEHCHLGLMRVPANGQEWHLECSECKAVQFCYTPMPHQHEFHKDSHKFRMWAGGYGSAKTSTCCAEIITHILETPKGMTLIGAATMPQLEQTAMDTFFKMFPEQLIKHYSKQKNYVDVINGHRVLFRPLDDEGKARSLNLSAFWIEEASEVKYEYFVQLQTRLRSHATSKHMGILSTNPDLNWVRQEFLMKSNRIEGSKVHYHQEKHEINQNFSTHIASTDKNIYLPPDYYESTAKGKPAWWIARYLDGSFEHTEGAVYPTFAEHIVQPFEIPKNWERLGAVDFGLRDPTVMLLGAIDPKDGVVYIYREHYEGGQAVPYHARKMQKMIEDIPQGLLRQPVADPSGKKKNINDRRSLFDHYAEYGIYFKEGNNRILDGIMKVFTYFSLGKLKVFSSCVNTIREGINYKYKDQTLDKDKNADETPIDKDNHSMDSLRYMINELPDDPTQLINESFSSQTYIKNKQETSLPFALQDDDDVYTADWQSYY